MGRMEGYNKQIIYCPVAGKTEIGAQVALTVRPKQEPL